MLVISAVIAAAVVGVLGCQVPDDPVGDAALPRQVVSVAWKVTDLADAELACDRIDAQFMTVTFFRVQTGEGFTEVFDCFRGGGMRELEEGEYMIGFELADRFGTLATRASQPYRVEGPTAVEEARFRIDPRGTLVFTLDTGLAANCGGGSSISGMTIEVYRPDGGCLGGTLAIEGAAPPYTINCANPPVASCLEKDRDVTAASVPAGEYRIRAVGRQGTMPCWLHDQRHRIRAAGLGRTVVMPMTKTCN
jgi:hypothetical protein